MKFFKIKKLIFGKRNPTGRNNMGLITVGYRGSVQKLKHSYRFIDFARKTNLSFSYIRIIKTNIYDPNRNARLMLGLTSNSCCVYLLEIANLNYGIKHGLKLGNMVQKPFSGESASLRNFSLGNLVCSINGTISRSAGNFSVILKKEHLKKMILKKKSGAISKFLLSTSAIKGIVGTTNYFLRNLEKAGNSRLLGIRPRNRPCSRNPVDTKLGGRTRGGIQAQNINGIQNHRKTTNDRKRHFNEVLTSRKHKLNNKQ